jgi:ABC-type arginine transport system permease subunit
MNLLLEYQLIDGTIMTIKLALTSLVIGLFFRLLGAWAKLSHNRLA